MTLICRCYRFRLFYLFATVLVDLLGLFIFTVLLTCVATQLLLNRFPEGFIPSTYRSLDHRLTCRNLSQNWCRSVCVNLLWTPPIYSENTVTLKCYDVISVYIFRNKVFLLLRMMIGGSAFFARNVGTKCQLYALAVFTSACTTSYITIKHLFVGAQCDFQNKDSYVWCNS